MKRFEHLSPVKGAILACCRAFTKYMSVTRGEQMNANFCGALCFMVFWGKNNLHHMSLL